MPETKTGLWCTYGWFLGRWGIGRIESSQTNVVYIRYSENQQYPPEAWESKWTHRFDTAEEAVDDFMKNAMHSDEVRSHKIEYLRRSFPSFLDEIPKE